jgi:hypothetical protein
MWMMRMMRMMTRMRMRMRPHAAVVSSLSQDTPRYRPTPLSVMYPPMASDLELHTPTFCREDEDGCMDHGSTGDFA